MKHSLFLTAAIATLAMPAMAHEKGIPAVSPAGAGADEAQPVVAVVEQFSAALKAADMARVGALLADDVLILESGGAERSREEYLRHHAVADAAFLGDAHVQVNRRTARIDGALAWVGTESELHATREGKALTLLGTETMVLRKTGGEWRIAHIHWSSRPKKSTP